MVSFSIGYYFLGSTIIFSRVFFNTIQQPHSSFFSCFFKVAFGELNFQTFRPRGSLDEIALLLVAVKVGVVKRLVLDTAQLQESLFFLGNFRDLLRVLSEISNPSAEKLYFNVTFPLAKISSLQPSLISNVSFVGFLYSGIILVLFSLLKSPQNQRGKNMYYSAKQKQVCLLLLERPALFVTGPCSLKLYSFKPDPRAIAEPARKKNIDPKH